MRVSCTTALLGAILLATIAQAGCFSCFSRKTSNPDDSLDNEDLPQNPDEWLRNKNLPLPAASSWVRRYFVQQGMVSSFTTGNTYLFESTLNEWAERSGVTVEVWKNGTSQNGHTSDLLYTTPTNYTDVTKIFVDNNNLIVQVSN